MSCQLGNWTSWDTCTLYSSAGLNLTSILANYVMNNTYSGDTSFSSECYLGYQSRNRNITGSCASVASIQWQECAVQSTVVDTYHPIFSAIYNNFGYLWFQRGLIIYWALVISICSLAILNLFFHGLFLRKLPNISLISWFLLLFGILWKFSYLSTLNFLKISENTTYQCLELGVCDCPHQSLFTSSTSSNSPYQAEKLIPLQEISIFGILVSYSVVFRYWFNFPKYFHIRLGEVGQYNFVTKRFTQNMAMLILLVFFLIGFILYSLSFMNPSIVPFEFSFRAIFVTLLPCLLLSTYYYAGISKILQVVKEDTEDDECEDDWSTIENEAYRMQRLLFLITLLCVLYVASQGLYFLDIYNEENGWIVLSILLLSSIIPRCFEVYIITCLLLLLLGDEERHFSYGHPIPFFGIFRYFFYGFGIDESKVEYGSQEDIDFILYPTNPYKNSTYFEFLKHRTILKYQLLSVQLEREIPLTLIERKELIKREKLETMNEEEQESFQKELEEQNESLRLYELQQEKFKAKEKRLQEDLEFAMLENVRLEGIRSDPEQYEDKVILIQRKYRRVTFRRRFIKCVTILAQQGRAKRMATALNFALNHQRKVVTIQRAWRKYLLMMRLQWLERIRYNDHIRSKLALETCFPQHGVSKYFKTYSSLHEEYEYINEQKLDEERYARKAGFALVLEEEGLIAALTSTEYYSLPNDKTYRHFPRQKELEKNFRDALLRAQKGFFDSKVFDKRNIQTDEMIIKSIFILDEEDFPMPEELSVHRGSSSLGSYSDETYSEEGIGGGSGHNSQSYGRSHDFGNLGGDAVGFDPNGLPSPPSTTSPLNKTGYKKKDNKIIGVKYKTKHEQMDNYSGSSTSSSKERETRKLQAREMRKRRTEAKRKRQEDFRRAELEKKARILANKPLNKMMATMKANQAMKIERIKDSLWDFYFVDEDGDRINLSVEELEANNKAHEEWNFNSIVGTLPISVKGTTATASSPGNNNKSDVESGTFTKTRTDGDRILTPPLGSKVHGDFRMGLKAMTANTDGNSGSILDPELLANIKYNWQKITIGDDDEIERHNRMVERRRRERMAQSRVGGNRWFKMGARWNRMFKRINAYIYDEDSYDDIMNPVGPAPTMTSAYHEGGREGGMGVSTNASSPIPGGPPAVTGTQVSYDGIEKEAYDKAVELTKSRKKRAFDVVQKNRSYMSSTEDSKEKKERREDARKNNEEHSGSSGNNNLFVSHSQVDPSNGNPYLELQSLVTELQVGGESSPLKDNHTHKTQRSNSNSQQQNPLMDTFQQQNPMMIMNHTNTFQQQNPMMMNMNMNINMNMAQTNAPSGSTNAIMNNKAYLQQQQMMNINQSMNQPLNQPMNATNPMMTQMMTPQHQQFQQQQYMNMMYQRQMMMMNQNQQRDGRKHMLTRRSPNGEANSEAHL